jgi:nicotinate-nucleotide pyrophosphorylase
MLTSGNRKFVDAIAAAVDPASSHKPQLLDTRKTTPVRYRPMCAGEWIDALMMVTQGLRMLEKYAVRCGGGYCHR